MTPFLSAAQGLWSGVCNLLLPSTYRRRERSVRRRLLVWSPLPRLSLGGGCASALRLCRSWEKHCCVTFPWFPALSASTSRAVSAAALTETASPRTDLRWKRKGGAPVAATEALLRPQPLRLKVRSIDDKKCMRLEPAGAASWGLFGADLVERLLWKSSSAGASKAAAVGNNVGFSSSLEADALCVAEGEFDAMAIYQETGMPTVSVPLGANSLPPALLPFFERFKKIYLVSASVVEIELGVRSLSSQAALRLSAKVALQESLLFGCLRMQWFDEDAAGREGADVWASKLGISRCLLVRTGEEVLRRKLAESGGESQAQSAGEGQPTTAPSEEREEVEKPPKDANEALMQGFKLGGFLQHAKRIPHSQILCFDDLRERVLDELLNPGRRAGGGGL